ncbi:MAG: hypothetical protein J0M17_20615 [Planctomycetes bacterium]|nr:hypothetical protein [Planctomycetota bacterium]
MLRAILPIRFCCEARLRRLVVGLGLAYFVGFTSSAMAAPSYSPESPEVKKAVAAAVAFLEKAPADQRLGAMALAGRVMVFQGKPDHPLVTQAVQAIRQTLQSPDVTDVTLIYSLGLSLVFLSELDATTYRKELEALADLLTKQQKQHGGWGYHNRPTGDTSMTQYAIYGLWTAGQQGVAAPENVWTSATHWLLAVQDVGGAWPYQGAVPESGGRTRQEDLRRSMTEAAVASLYLSGNYFDVFDFRPKSEKPAVSSLLKPVNAPPVREARQDPREMNAALSSGSLWLQGTKDGISEQFPYYHLYTLERLHTFRTAALKKPDADAWYDEGVRYLLEKQATDGGWDGGEGRIAGTSFAVLFLIRSTRAALQKIDALGPGTLYGGRGLPTTRPARSGASVPGVTAPQAGLEGLLKRMDDPAFAQSLTGLEDLQPLKDQPAPSELTKRLTELAKGDTPEAKAAALRALGRGRDIGAAPILIEALGDPDPLVYQTAVDGLRYLSRDFANYGKTLPADPIARRVEADKWREWYRKIRPFGD